jgi:hypothetical protein
MYYKDYLEAIVRFYKRREGESSLPQRLLQPTNSKIRDECVSVYRERFEQKDLGMLKTFFEVHGQTDILKAIENVDIEKFKPLTTYLKKGLITATEDKNIELLGWLLNFHKRPYDSGYSYDSENRVLPKDRMKPVGENLIEESVNGVSLKEPKQMRSTAQTNFVDSRGETTGKNGLYKKKWLVAMVVLLGIGLAAYFNGRGRTSFGSIGPGQNGCMVWIDYRYEQVSCDSPSKGRLVLPFEKSILNNLYRITRPDTITEKYIGKLWYQKRGVDSLDLYTAGGRDPNDPGRDLKRLSKHIFDNYLSKKKR